MIFIFLNIRRGAIMKKHILSNYQHFDYIESLFINNDFKSTYGETSVTETIETMDESNYLIDNIELL
jgi:hypothetical protein